MPPVVRLIHAKRILEILKDGAKQEDKIMTFGSDVTWGVKVIKMYGGLDIVVFKEKNPTVFPCGRRYCQVRIVSSTDSTSEPELLGGTWQSEGWNWQFGPIPLDIGSVCKEVEIKIWTVNDMDPEPSPSKHHDSVLKTMFDSTDTDLTLVSKEKVNVSVHMAVFKAASPVFQTMLLTDMKESRDGKIVMKDLGVRGVKILKRFVYLGEFGKGFEQCTFKELKELVSAGEKYELNGLKNKAAEQLLKHLTPENALELFAFMKRFDLKKKMYEVLDYLKKNRNLQVTLEKICQELNM